MTPLRIGITCYPTFGGSGVIATELGLSLARRGHLVHFICYDVPIRFDRFEKNVFFHEVEVNDYPLFQHSQYPLTLASKMVEVSRYEKLDLLHVHYAVPHATSAYLMRQVIGAGAPRLVTTLHGTDITLVGSDLGMLPITRFSIMQSDGITVPSKYLREATWEKLDVPRDVPIEVIPNFVDHDRFRPGPAGAVPALIHISNFRPVKRVEDVVRIFAEVRKSVAARLILVGDGPERSRIEALVHELGLSGHVCFFGKQLNFHEVLRQSQVFLLPSQTESFGLAALEALSSGVPVVASNVGGLPEVVRDGETGYLAPVGDVAAMAARAVQLLEDVALHDRMAKAARRSVEEEWTLEPAITRYEDYYQKVLTTSSTP